MDAKNIYEGKSSEVKSPYATLENLGQLSGLCDRLSIPSGNFFVAGKPKTDRKDLFAIKNTELFVQGFGVYSVRKGYIAPQRNYSNIIVGEQDGDVTVDEKTVFLKEAQIYEYYLHKRRVSLEAKEAYYEDIPALKLVMENGQWKEKDFIEKLFATICKKNNLTSLVNNDVGQFMLDCKYSQWYFLKGHRYKVWSQVINEGNAFTGKPNEVLVCDQNSGFCMVIKGSDELIPEKYRNVFTEI